MKLRLNRNILKSLLSFYPNRPKGHLLGRLKKLAGFICGMIRTKESTMSAVGSGLPQDITAYSKEKACKNFLDNRWNEHEIYYLPYIEKLLPLFIEQANTGANIYFAIDGSQMGNEHVALMLNMMNLFH